MNIVYEKFEVTYRDPNPGETVPFPKIHHGIFPGRSMSMKPQVPVESWVEESVPVKKFVLDAMEEDADNDGYEGVVEGLHEQVKRHREMMAAMVDILAFENMITVEQIEALIGGRRFSYRNARLLETRVEDGGDLASSKSDG